MKPSKIQIEDTLEKAEASMRHLRKILGQEIPEPIKVKVSEKTPSKIRDLVLQITWLVAWLR